MFNTPAARSWPRILLSSSCDWRSRPQPQRPGMHARDERVRSLHRFPIDMEQHRLARSNRHLAHAVRIDAAPAIDAPREERRNAQHVPDEAAIPNDDEIEQSVFEIGAGGNVRAESPLRRVRERENERGRLRRLAIDLDRVFDRLVAKQVAGCWRSDTAAARDGGCAW